MDKKKKVNTKLTACHSCRRHHTACDNQRPCQTCVSRRRKCFAFDRNLSEAVIPWSYDEILLPSPTSSSSSSSSSSPLLMFHYVEELDAKKREVQEVEQKCLELTLKNEDLRQQIVNPTPRNEIRIDLWDSCQELLLPQVFYDLTKEGYPLIGCNKAFRELSGFQVHELKNYMSIFQLITQRLRNQWQMTSKWVLTAPVHTLACFMILNFKGQDVCAKVNLRLFRNFAYATIEIVDYYSDEFTVNDEYRPGRFQIPNALPNIVSTPADSFDRLIEVLANMKIKSVYADQAEHQETTIQMMREQVQLMQQQRRQQQTAPFFAPVSLSENELRLVQQRMQTSSNQMTDIPPTFRRTN
jgi:hypothetical protein